MGDMRAREYKAMVCSAHASKRAGQNRACVSFLKWTTIWSIAMRKVVESG